MKIFARIAKIDEATRTVTGVIANETKDYSGEIFDYATSKPFFEAWSGNIAKATDGKSLGNVRVMHGNVVAGVTKAIDFNDLASEISVSAKIVDDNEWNKTLAGCYTGFSIGGAYKNKWDTAEGKRYTAAPNEYSLVDLPCNPGATFTVIKAAGGEELRKFAPAPLDLKKLCAGVLAVDSEKIAKGMWNVSRLAELLQDLAWTQDDVEWEAACEQDGSTIPRELRDIVAQLGSVLVRMTQEEVKELTASDAMLALSAKATLQKLSQHKEDAMSEELKKARDDAVAALATANTTLAKRDEELAKAVGERDDLQKKLDDAAKAAGEAEEMMTKAAVRIGELDAIVQKFNNLPAPLKASLTAVAKSADAAVAGGGEEEEVVKAADGTVDKVATALRKALSQPLPASK